MGAAEMGAAIRCPGVGDSPRGTETAEPLSSTPKSRSPPSRCFGQWHGPCLISDLSVRFSPSTRERLPPWRPEALNRHPARMHVSSLAHMRTPSSRRMAPIAAPALMDPSCPWRVATRIHGIHGTHERPTGRCYGSVGGNTNISACTRTRGVARTPPNSSPAPMRRTKHRRVARRIHGIHAKHGRSSGGRRRPGGPVPAGGRVGRAEPAGDLAGNLHELRERDRPARLALIHRCPETRRPVPRPRRQCPRISRDDPGCRGPRSPRPCGRRHRR
jgi:hypothetical protein